MSRVEREKSNFSSEYEEESSKDVLEKSWRLNLAEQTVMAKWYQNNEDRSNRWSPGQPFLIVSGLTLQRHRLNHNLSHTHTL